MVDDHENGGYQRDRKNIEWRLGELHRELRDLRDRLDGERVGSIEKRAQQGVDIREIQTTIRILGAAIVIVGSAMVGYVLKLLFGS